MGTTLYSKYAIAAEVAVKVPALVPTWHAHGQGGFYSGGGFSTTLDVDDWTVTAGDLLVIYLGAELDGDPVADPVFSVTGGGLTWVQAVQARTTATFNSQSAIFWAKATTTTTITDIQVTQGSPLSISWAAERFSGQDAIPIGASAGVATAGGVDGTYDLTLGSTPLATSVLRACMFENADENNTTKKIDHGASDGWVELLDNGPELTGASNWGVFEVQGHAPGWTSTRVRWDDAKPTGVSATYYSVAACAIEIMLAGSVVFDVPEAPVISATRRQHLGRTVVDGTRQRWGGDHRLHGAVPHHGRSRFVDDVLTQRDHDASDQRHRAHQ